MATPKQRSKRRAKRLTASLSSSVISLDPVEVNVHLEAAEGGRHAAPHFESVAYSGGRLFVAGFSDPVVVDLAGLELAANLNILLDHKSSQRVGHATDVQVTDVIRVTGLISASSQHATEVVESARSGFRWHVSIGARVIAAYKLPKGRQAIVNGRTFTGPLVVATKSKLNEISFVGVGGDEQNQVQIAAEHDTGEHAMTFQEWLTAKGYDESNLTAEMLKPLQAAYALEYDADGNAIGEEYNESGTGRRSVESGTGRRSVEAGQREANESATESDNESDDPVQVQRLAAAAEQSRINTVSTILAAHEELQVQAIEEGWDEVRAELEQMRADRDASGNDGGGAPAGHSRSGRMNSSQAIEASLCMQFGIAESDVSDWYNDRTMEAALSSEYRGIGLHQLIYRSLQASGQHFVPGRMDDETIRSFLQAEVQLQASAPGNFSHLATTGILSNVANKRLLNAFNSVEGIVPTIFGATSVSDFKVNTGYRLAASGELEEVTSGGEIRHGDLSEESFTNQAKTWGKMLTLSRTNIINDDLSAFDRIPRILGRKARLKLEKEGIKLMLNPAAGYYTAANSFSGAGTALSITSLTQAEEAFDNQVDSAGDPILLNAKYLVAGTGLKVTAQVLMNETTIISIDQSGTANSQAPAQNPHAGKWTPRTSPFINVASHGLTNNSATAWWLVGDPQDEPAFVISYLNGRRTPAVESSDVDFNRLGMSWRVVWDFGVDEQESRAIVRMLGA